MSTQTGLVTSHGCHALPPGIGSGGMCGSSHGILFDEEHESFSFTPVQISSAAATNVVSSVHKTFDEIPPSHPSPILAATLNRCNDNQRDPDDSVDDSSSSALDLTDYPSTLASNTLSSFSSFGCHGRMTSDHSSPSVIRSYAVHNLSPSDKASFPVCSPNTLPADDNDEETDIVPSELIQFVSESTRRIQGDLTDAVSVDGSDIEALDHDARLASLCLPILQPPSIVSSHISDGLRPPSLSPQPSADNYSDSDFPKAYFSESMESEPLFRGSNEISLGLSASLQGISSEDRSISSSALMFSASDNSTSQVIHLSTAAPDVFSLSCGVRTSEVRMVELMDSRQELQHHDVTLLRPNLATTNSPLPFRSVSSQEPIISRPLKLEPHDVHEVADFPNIATLGPFASTFCSQAISAPVRLMDLPLFSNPPHSRDTTLVSKVDEPGASCSSILSRHMENTQSALRMSTYNPTPNGFTFPSDSNPPGCRHLSTNSTDSAGDLHDRNVPFHPQLSSSSTFPVSSVALSGNSQPIFTRACTVPPVASTGGEHSPFVLIGRDSVNMASSSAELRFITHNYVNFDSSKPNISLTPDPSTIERPTSHFLLAPPTHPPNIASPQTNLTFQLLSSLPALRPGMSILFNLKSGADNGFVSTSSASIVLNTNTHLVATNAVVLLHNLAGTAISRLSGTTAPLTYQQNLGLPPTSTTNFLSVIPPISSTPVPLATSLASANVHDGVNSTMGAHSQIPLTTHVLFLRSASTPQIKSDPDKQNVIFDSISTPPSRTPLLFAPATSQMPITDPQKLLFIPFPSPGLAPIVSSSTYENTEQHTCSSSSTSTGAPSFATSYNAGVSFGAITTPGFHGFDSVDPGSHRDSLTQGTALHHVSLATPTNQVLSFPLTLLSGANTHSIFSSSLPTSASQTECVTEQPFLPPISALPPTASNCSLPLHQCPLRPSSLSTYSIDTNDLGPPTNPLALFSLFPPTFSPLSLDNALSNAAVDVHGAATPIMDVIPKSECTKGTVLPSADNLLSSRSMKPASSISASGSASIQPNKNLGSKYRSSSYGSSTGDTGSPFLCNSGAAVSNSNRRRHQCPFCPKSCERKDNLQAHIRTHTGERPYPCRFCPKAFPQKDHLRAHIRTHTGEKPYRCPQCLKAFAQLGNLHRHVKTHRR
ncbi:unnamed protein product [Dicrocoelium dendriticum]|nr:unnamed protein product [Dicrocoelium dendriticum]